MTDHSLPYHYKSPLRPQEIARYEFEIAWGIPHASPESFQQTAENVRYINTGFVAEVGEVYYSFPTPFSWKDEEIQHIARSVLLLLRSKKVLTTSEIAQLCWLERSLEESFFQAMQEGDDTPSDSFYPLHRDLINEQQLALLQRRLQIQVKVLFETTDEDSMSSVNIPEEIILMAEQAREHFDEIIIESDSDTVQKLNVLIRERMQNYLTQII